MSHLTPNLYIVAAVVVNSVRSLFLLPSAIINKQLARTNNKYSRINLRLSSIFAYFFSFDHHLISDSDDNTFYPLTGCDIYINDIKRLTERRTILTTVAN